MSTREFRLGDSLRSIHWRSWARTGKPIVKEFQEEFFCRIALVLDTFVGSIQNEKKAHDFEAVVSLAAAVADNLAREEYVTGLFAAGPELYRLQSGRSLAHLENVMDILACLEPCSDPAFEKLQPVLIESLENITTTILILLRWDSDRERLVRAILDRGTAIKLILIGEPLSPQESAVVESLTGSFVWLHPDQLDGKITRL